MAGLDPLDHGLAAALGQVVEQVHAGIVRGQDVQRGHDADIRRHHRLRRRPLAVAGDRDVAHGVDIADVGREVVDGGLGALGDALHQLLLRDIVGAFGRVDLLLADAPVGTADADVLVAAAEATHGVALEVGQHQERVIVQHALAHVHLLKPLAALDGERGHAVLVGDVHRAEGPAVDGQGLAVLLGGVAAALIIGVGLDDGGFGQARSEQLLHPGAGDDVGSLSLAGVELDRHLAGQHRGDLVVDLFEPLLRQVAGEEHHGTLPRALFKGDVQVAPGPGNRLLFRHCRSSLNTVSVIIPQVPGLFPGVFFLTLDGKARSC